ncbi:MAG: hypothetical protein R3B82_23475 [Sandaracinaceae bacterium]
MTRFEWLVCAVLVGCGGSPTGDAGTTDAGPSDAALLPPDARTDASTDASTDPSTDASTADDGGADAGASDAGSADSGTTVTDGGAPSAVGLVAVTQAGGQRIVSGFFTRDLTLDHLLAGNLSPLCVDMRREGACRIVECPPGATAGPWATAGTLTATVEGASLATVTASPDGSYLDSAAGSAFAAGDRVGLAVSGDVVPAFSLETTAPVTPSASMPATLDRAAGLTLSWTSATPADDAQLVLASGSRALVCYGPDAGAFTVSPSLLSELDPTSTAILSLAVFNSTHGTVGEWEILASASQGVLGGVVALE